MHTIILHIVQTCISSLYAYVYVIKYISTCISSQYMYLASLMLHTMLRISTVCSCCNCCRPILVAIKQPVLPIPALSITTRVYFITSIYLIEDNPVLKRYSSHGMHYILYMNKYCGKPGMIREYIENNIAPPPTNIIRQTPIHTHLSTIQAAIHV